MPNVIERTQRFWDSFLAGEPLDIDSGNAVVEDAGGRYDVGDIVRGYTRAWLGVEPNHATPVELIDLLDFLDRFTTELERIDLERRSDPIWVQNVTGPLVPGAIEMPIAPEILDRYQAGYLDIHRQLTRWRVRLDDYTLRTQSVPIDDQFDRRAVLWDVTAPLFLGWYGGETGTEVELPPDGFPPGFNTESQHPPDIATPYTIANQLGIWLAWEDERKRRLIEDITPDLPGAANVLLLVAALGAVAYGSYKLITTK